MTPAIIMLTLAQALNILARLESAAPRSTAEKLEQVANLLRALDTDNADLRAMYEDTANRHEALRAQHEADDAAELLRLLDNAMREMLTGLQRYAASLPSPATERVGDYAGGGIRLLDSMRDLLALSRDTLEVDPLVFSSTLLLREAHRAVEERARASRHQIDLQVPKSELQAYGDYTRSLTILIDLLDNAIRYTPEGGTIRLSAENLGTHVLFSVADDGIGLLPDDLEHITEPFWRAKHQPLVMNHAGTGLRLYLAQCILALQEGELIFSGEYGFGSTFSFTLPAGAAL